uniref:Uncharacterized protein n=1 Tax=Physcomitrium patens TaxID=3218 RepID=A0A2K1KEN9_PHYPA|nr:hypothetical protein PHYPA_008614 [Physcomitrium patens]
MCLREHPIILESTRRSRCIVCFRKNQCIFILFLNLFCRFSRFTLNKRKNFHFKDLSGLNTFG